MTTRTTTIESSKPSARALIGMTAASLALLGGVLLWQARPGSETAPVAATATSAAREGVAPTDGLAELYAQQQADRFAEEAARIGALGGWDAPYRASTRSTCGTLVGDQAC